MVAIHQLFCTREVALTTVAFCPLLPYTPTSQDAVYSALKNFVGMCNSLGRKYQIYSCDMAIYVIAKNIQLCTNEFPSLILRIGTFHLQKNFLRCLGQYIEGSGLDEIIIQSEVYGPTTFKSMLEGKQYNRAIRAHKMVYEAYRFLQLSEYLEQKGKLENSERFLPLLQEIREIIVDKDKNKLLEVLNDNQNVIQSFLGEFEKHVSKSCEENETYRFHNHYCSMVEILLDSIKADRSNDLDLHLQSTRKMLPYFFSMNHYIYARGVSSYLQDMARLPTEIVDEFGGM